MPQSTGLIEVTSHTDALVRSAAIPNRQYLTELGKKLKNQLLSPSINPSDMACCSLQMWYYIEIVPFSEVYRCKFVGKDRIGTLSLTV